MMPAGEYYVGDLCYVMDEDWDEVLSLIIKGNEVLDGEFSLKDGRRFAIYSTAWGDGGYYDQFGNEYGVDAGSIGCILVSDIREEDLGNLNDLGTVHSFPTDFVTAGGRGRANWDGVIMIGRVKIETDPKMEDEDEYYYR